MVACGIVGVRVGLVSGQLLELIYLIVGCSGMMTMEMPGRWFGARTKTEDSGQHHALLTLKFHLSASTAIKAALNTKKNAFAYPYLNNLIL